jgi:WD40 repeat protein
MALAPDGRTLATGHTGKLVRLWDLATGKEIRRWPAGEPIPKADPQAPQGVVWRVAFSPDGKLLLWQSRMQLHASVRDVASGREICQLPSPTVGDWTSLAFVGNGAVAGTIRLEKTMRTLLWDLTRPEAAKTIREFPSCDRAELAASPDGKYLAQSDMTSLRVTNHHSGRELWQVPLALVNRTVFTADGSRLYAVAQSNDWRYGGSILGWDTATGREVLKVELPIGKADIVLSPDGCTIAGRVGYTIRLWDARSGQELRPRAGHTGPVGSIAVAPDGRSAVSVGWWENDVLHWDLATGRLLGRFAQSRAGFWDVAYSPDGTRLAATTGDQTVCVWDAATRRRLLEIRERTGLGKGLEFSADGDNLLTFTQDVWLVLKVYSARSGQPVGSRQTPYPTINRFGGEIPITLACTPDGRELLVPAPILVRFNDTDPEDYIEHARVWDLTARRELFSVRVEKGPLRCAVLTPDGRALVTRHGDNTIRVWELATGGERTRFPVGDGKEAYGQQSLAVAPDGRTLAAAGQTDGSVHLWDLVTGARRAVLSGHSARAHAVAFTPDGRRLLSADRHTTILVWDVTAIPGRAPRPAKPLDRQSLSSHWTALAGADAEAAFRAMIRLADDPERGVAFLGERLLSATTPDPDTVRGWINGLDDARFAERERAFRQLREHAERSERLMVEALQENPSAEVRQRLQRILDELKGAAVSPEKLRQLRAVEILERVGDGKARELLARLGRDARKHLADAAVAALRRLDRLPPPRVE